MGQLRMKLNAKDIFFLKGGHKLSTMITHGQAGQGFRKNHLITMNKIKIRLLGQVVLEQFIVSGGNYIIPADVGNSEPGVVWFQLMNLGRH